MQSFGTRQASINRHLELARKCLALSTPQDSLSIDDPLQCLGEAVEQPQHGSRIAAKIIHLRNLITALTPVPATTEADQFSMLGRFRASVETLWSDRRDRMDTPFRLGQQAHIPYPSVSRRSLELSPCPTSRHRRAGSSRI